MTDREVLRIARTTFEQRQNLNSSRYETTSSMCSGNILINNDTST